MRHLYLILSLLFLVACSEGKRQNKNSVERGKVAIHYAKGFSIKQYDGYTEIIVNNPWDSTQLLETYILVDRERELPADLPKGKLVRVPVEKSAIATSVHVGIWKMLNQMDKIVAVTEPEYIDFPEIKEGLKKGIIVDLGRSTAINLERLIVTNPDILVVSPYEQSSYGRLEKSKTVIVQDASYMEESPLGRAEWIKFEAAFTCQDSLANVLFSKIENRYNELCQLVDTVTYRPTVFTERKTGQAWYVPGGNSYMGKFFKDAGANYFWMDLMKTGSIPLAFEAVYDKAHAADFWLIKYNNVKGDMTYEQLQQENPLYANFKPFQSKTVFACNTGKKPFYEEGSMEPDVILADMISIFHPQLLKDYKAKYYERLK